MYFSRRIDKTKNAFGLKKTETKANMIHFNKYLLPTQFSDAIQSIWSIQFGEQAAIMPIIPDGYPEIIIPLYGSVQSFVGSEQGIYCLDRPFVIGQLGKTSYLQSTGKAAFVSIKLYPWLLSAILKDKASLAKKSVDRCGFGISKRCIDSLERFAGYF